MPTTLYSKTHGSVSHNGKEYVVKGGKVDVPDDAVAPLVEAHGFTTEPSVDIVTDEELKDKDVFNFEALTKTQLINLNDDAELGAELKTSMKIDEIRDILRPLWEQKAKEAA